MKLVLLVLGAALTAANAAEAQTAQQGAAALAEAVRPGIARKQVRPQMARLPANDEAARPAGVARTSIDHRFAREDLTGSLGFLCGRQESLAGNGGSAVYGTDPQGRFLGVKLAFAVR